MIVSTLVLGAIAAGLAYWFIGAIAALGTLIAAAVIAWHFHSWPKG